MMAAAPDDLRESLYKAIPYPPRFGQPEEFASFVEHAITNPYLNGETVSYTSIEEERRAVLAEVKAIFPNDKIIQGIPEKLQ